jgi:molybdate transport system substrate-binding protein
LLGATLLILSLPAWAGGNVMVYAAASTSNAINAVAALYEQEKGVKINASFAASPALAKQIEEGAPAGIFISADLKWMDYLQQKGRIVAETRRNLLGNELVMIAPKGKTFTVRMDKSFDLPAAFEGRWCTCDPAGVPIGIYSKQALTSFGWWQAMESRLVTAPDVRAALAFVERGECAMGIVYETDAKSSDQVAVLGTFPADSHQPVVYPVALTQGAGQEAKGFLDFLVSEPAAAVFTRYGFTVLGR